MRLQKTRAFSEVLVVEAVADSFQLAPEDLIGKKRDKDTALARRIAMYIIRQETNSSLAQIGEELGGRDAASVTNACKSVAAGFDNNPYLNRTITDIRKKIHPRQKS